MSRRFKKLVDTYSKTGLRGILSLIRNSVGARTRYLKFRAEIKYAEIQKLITLRFRSRLDLQGWFSEHNQKSLGQVIDNLITDNKISKPLNVLEIGSWKGLSTSIICRHIQKISGSRLVCIDHWKYNEGAGEDFERLARAKDVFAIFRTNMEILGFNEIVKPFFGSSSNLDLFQKESFDLIFIDGDHRYSAFSADLKNALRLVKPGGVICGDDGEMSAVNFDNEFLISNRNRDVATDEFGKSCHPGVVLALQENFGNHVNFENEHAGVGVSHNFWWIKAEDWTQFQSRKVPA